MASPGISLVVVVFHIIIPFGLIGYLYWRSSLRQNRLIFSAYALMSGAYLVFFLYFGSGWSWVSYYIPYLQLGLFVGVVLSALSDLVDKPWLPQSGWLDWAKFGLMLVISSFFILPMPMYWGAQEFKPEPVELQFPFRDGTYFVGHGGTSRALNHHYRKSGADFKAQRYALDVVKLNSLGTRASGLYPTDLKRYEIFGQPVVAPCKGTVSSIRSDVKDLPPPRRTHEHLTGNYVALHCQKSTFVLAHLKSGSVSVEPGDNVKKGQRIGKIGNSGNTTEPHLHLHAVEGDVTDMDSLTKGAEPVPMVFGWQKDFYIRNDIVSTGEDS